jgi:Amt family ammonium transporter
MGNGVQAALVAMIIKTEYEKLKYIDNPAHLLEAMNKSFFESYGILNVFFSCIVLDIDTVAKELIFSSAGHPDQVFIHGDELEIIKHTGKLMGIVENSTYTIEKRRYKNNDKIILFTDGLFEQYNAENENFGREKVYECIDSSKGMNVTHVLNQIIADLRKFLQTEERIALYDDITIIGIEIE